MPVIHLILTIKVMNLKSAKNILIFLMVLILPASSMTFSRILRRAMGLCNQKHYREADSLLSENISSLKGRDRYRGMLLLAGLERNIEEAKEIYRNITGSAGPVERLRARLELAKMHYSMSRYDRVTRILEIIPERAGHHDILEAHFYLGMSWKEMGGIENARYNFSRIDRGPFLYWSYIYLAELDMQEGKIESAVERYESIASEHYNPIAGFKLGECYEIMGERSKALKVYRTLASRFPGSPESTRAREKIQMIEYSKENRVRLSGREIEQGEAGEEGSPKNNTEISPYFTIQMGAFRLRENAIKLSSRLGENFEGVRVERFVSDGDIWYRVRMGNFAGREQAEKESKRILREFGYTSRVIPVDSHGH